ncbi:5073_t:CDS:1 [Cetraspora pellucida]|uniref:5073_t:CDS:1 n=1 Tax=Cetraspora pellucida TaxID=1433469 RepID=A0A9N9FS16_9GLOM|nr:5073_t:CDS:1 [Cetraspora pellucida]
MASNIELLRTVLETHAINKRDFFSNFDIYYPESFFQIFGNTFSEKDIKEAIKQLQNEEESNGINGEIVFNENDRKLSLFKCSYTMLTDFFLKLWKTKMCIYLKYIP